MDILTVKAILNCKGYDMLPYVLCYRNLKEKKSRNITDSGQTILSLIVSISCSKNKCINSIA